MATFYKSDGTVEIKKPKGDTFSLEEMQEYVGGYVEPVFLGQKTVMLVDEEGRLKKKPINYLASDLACTMIVGDVLIGTLTEMGFEEDKED